MLHIDDLLDEADLLAYDGTALEAFAPTTGQASRLLEGKRTLAIRAWLAQAFEHAGYPPIRHSARRAPDKVLGYTAAAWSDHTSALSDKTLDDLALASVIASPGGGDALYIGYSEPFRALWLTLVDSVNTNSLTASSISYWTGQWSAFNSLVDGTARTTSISLSGAGRLRWAMPTDWEKRPLQDEGTWRFWLRLSLNQAPSAGCRVTQALPIRISRFTDPAAKYALSVLYGESWGAQRGEWKEKAAAFAQGASASLLEVLSVPQVADEFLLDDQEAVRPLDINSASPQMGSELTTWSRG